MFTSEEVYRDSEDYTLVIFDLRLPGVAERLHHERVVWQERSDIESLDHNHCMLTARLGDWRSA